MTRVRKADVFWGRVGIPGSSGKGQLFWRRLSGGNFTLTQDPSGSTCLFEKVRSPLSLFMPQPSWPRGRDMCSKDFDLAKRGLTFVLGSGK